MQDYYDPIQPFDYICDKLDDAKVELGIRYIARFDEELRPAYPAVLVNMEAPLMRDLHATRQFLVQFNIDIWVFHSDLTKGKAVRSREDVLLATEIRKLLHADYTLDDHIIFGYVINEAPGRTTRVVGNTANTVVTTRLMWTGTNRVRFEDS
jgi:hypothetical protein